MAKAKAKSKTNPRMPKAPAPKLTFEMLNWGTRMLRYVTTELEADYDKVAVMHTYLLTKRDVPDLFIAFAKWVKALTAQYELKDAMEIFARRYRDCMTAKDPHNESQGEMMRLTFHNTFPNRTVEGVTHFSKYCLDVAIKDGTLATTYFNAYSDEEAFDAVTQAFLDQDETASDDRLWAPTGMKYLSNSGGHVDITKEFFDHSGDLVKNPNMVFQASIDDEEEEPGTAEWVDKQIIGEINDLLDSLDSDSLAEWANNILGSMETK